MFRPFVLPAAFLPSLIVLSAASIIAQNQPSEPQPINSPDPIVEKKAYQLLDNLSEQVNNLRLPSNRIRTECAIADLIWTHDEKQARTILKSASAQLSAAINQLDFSDQEVYQQLNWINQERRDLIGSVERRDLELALSLLRATRVPVPSNSQFRWQSEMDVGMEMHLAALIAKKDPARTLQLARERLSQGVTSQLVDLLNELKQNDPSAAEKLYKEMIEEVKSENLSNDGELGAAAWRMVSFQPQPDDLNDYKSLLNVLTAATVSITPSDQASLNQAMNISNQLLSLMGQIEKSDPERAAALKQWSENIERSFDPYTRMNQELSRISQSGTVDDVLNLASKYPEDLRGQVYQQAAVKAFSEGDSDRAHQIAELISDPMQKKQMLDQFDNQTLDKAINENKVADTMQLIKRMKPVERRIQILARLAKGLAANGDKKGALDLLNQGKDLLDAMPPGLNEMMARLELIRDYSSLDAKRSFEMLQPIVAKTNELVNAATVLDGFEIRYFNQGEWITPGGSNLANVVVGVCQTMAMLANTDFERTRAMANQLERPELRFAAELDIARVALGREAPPINGPTFLKGFVIDGN